MHQKKKGMRMYAEEVGTFGSDRVHPASIKPMHLKERNRITYSLKSYPRC